ncbi:hypothetical protein [Flavobacterium sp. HSC-61S13]|uniref:hypothetical protein n=1 Tax=Flavobacterium sp. HSC-61S13 TaxID=2910963 RepID=UPI00209CBD61|nr:hypothetical protein [Flavobacterium sp. HSC-61S13]MCP1994491.1 hypothetical protein [Flavobacterium sp. HSC-61S13]
MKAIIYNYDSIENSNLTTVISKALGGVAKDNLIKGDNNLYKGVHFVLDVGHMISAVVADLLYKDDTFISYRNKESNSIGLYFFYTNKFVDFRIDDKISLAGSGTYNLLFMDVGLPIDYFVEEGTSIYSINIFIEKELMRKYLKDMLLPNKSINEIMDSNKRAILCNNYISSKSLKLINKFKKHSHTKPFYDMYFKGLVFSLINDFLVEIQDENYFIQNN